MSLRARILLLVLLATLVPAALLALYLAENRRNQIARAEEGLSALATHTADSLRDRVAGTVQLLHGLSRAPDLETADRDACSAFLGEVLKRYPQYTGLLTIRPDGQLHCDSLRTGRNLDLNDRAYFKQASATREPAYELVYGRLTGTAVLQVAFPAVDPGGNLKYILLASLNLSEFAAGAALASPYPGMEMVIWDRRGTVMVRLPDPGEKKLAGTLMADAPLFRFASAGRAGDTTELPGPDGTPRIWGLGILESPPGTGLRLTAGITPEVLLADADRELRQALGLLVVATLLAFGGALLIAEIGIRRHLQRITTAAARQGGGEAAARIGPPYPGGELGALMRKLDATAAAVETQQTEIRRVNRTLRMLSEINATIVRVRRRDELLNEACRIAAEDGGFAVAWIGLVDREKRQIYPAAWRGIDAEYLAAIPRGIDSPVGIAVAAVREERAVVVEDSLADPRLHGTGHAIRMGSRSAAALPLTVSGGVSGVLVLHAREPGFFDQGEIRLLQEVAGDIGFALEYLEKSERLDHLAYFDALTGLANRTLFFERVGQFIGIAGREGLRVAVVVFDLERFRTINDTLGRQAGDELLKQVAMRAAANLTERGWLARIGADQFAVLVPAVADREAVARRIERRHREIFDAPFRIGDAELRIAARIGVACFPEDGADAEQLFRNAEAALRQAKSGGERMLFYAAQMTERAAENLTLENQLRQALERGEFVLHYQPKVEVEGGRCVGVEALIRWQSPELGLVPPGRFIPLLEQTGLILQAGDWALRRAVADYEQLRRNGVAPPRIAVNVSAIQLRQRDFVDRVRAIVGGGPVPAGIDIEITESLLMDDIEVNVVKLRARRDLGMKIAIDDFGTGYSSLGYLAKLPVHALKIDRSFIITMLDDPDTMTLVSTIISLARSLRLSVVAEGVDSEEQAKMLRLLRCDQMQGFLVSRAVPLAELEAFLGTG
jgi:diguanylate cyclase (GGDEF)-like protein